jgi:hypothetical protein
VLTCCKNNDGQLGDRSVWVRENGLWSVAHGFDWNEWDIPEAKPQTTLGAAALREVFDGGNKALKLSEAAQALMTLTGKKKSVCYDALNMNGKFANSLFYDPKTRLIRWIP